MAIIQSMRRVLYRQESSAPGRCRILNVLSVALLTVLLSLSMVSPSMAQGGDNDGDGLANGDENRYGTDRTVFDTDGDGLSDGDEVYITSTNPTLRDSDYDWLSDGYEWNRGTLPNDSDSDNDGLNDGVEETVYFTNPLHPDTDADNLTDQREILIGTNPNNRDTDFDGIPDNADRYPLDRAFS